MSGYEPRSAWEIGAAGSGPEMLGEAADHPAAAGRQARLCELLRAFVAEVESPLLDGWFAALSPEQLRRLKADLDVVLREPELTGEPLDWRELGDVLREYAYLARWDGPLWPSEPFHCDGAQAAAPYRVDVRPQDLRGLERASPAVRRAAREVLEGILPWNPGDVELCGTHRQKKLSNRDIWQIDLPDGYRLRYCLDPDERVAYVVYLGPHPEGAEDGRERVVRARIQRLRHERGCGRWTVAEKSL